MKPVAAFLLTLLLTTSGCSLIFVDGPPQVRPGGTVPATTTCTTTPLVPLADALIAAAAGIGFTRALHEGSNPQVETYLLAYSVPVFLAGSSVEGFRRVKRCQEFMLTPVVNGEGATATSEAYFPWRPSTLLPLVQPPLVPRESDALPVPHLAVLLGSSSKRIQRGLDR